MIKNMSINIIPGILEKRWEDIEDKIEIINTRYIYNKSITKVQIDICDGVYVKSHTWSPMTNSVENKKLIESLIDKGMPNWEDFEYEADLMVSDLKSYIEKVSELGFASVVLHSESLEDLKSAVSHASDYMLIVGIASRDIEVILSYLDFIKEIDNVKSQNNNIDFIQIMGIKEIGKQGEPFDESVIDKIKSIRVLTDINIQIDGAMNDETIELCRVVGANHFVEGSAYFT